MTSNQTQNTQYRFHQSKPEKSLIRVEVISGPLEGMVFDIFDIDVEDDSTEANVDLDFDKELSANTLDNIEQEDINSEIEKIFNDILDRAIQTAKKLEKENVEQSE